MKEVICSFRGLEFVGVREAEAIMESFNMDFVSFESHVSFSENYCVWIHVVGLDDENWECAFYWRINSAYE